MSDSRVFLATTSHMMAILSIREWSKLGTNKQVLDRMLNKFAALRILHVHTAL